MISGSCASVVVPRSVLSVPLVSRARSYRRSSTPHQRRPPEAVRRLGQRALRDACLWPEWRCRSLVAIALCSRGVCLHISASSWKASGRLRSMSDRGDNETISTSVMQRLSRARSSNDGLVGIIFRPKTSKAFGFELCCQAWLRFSKPGSPSAFPLFKIFTISEYVHPSNGSHSRL